MTDDQDIRIRGKASCDSSSGGIDRLKHGFEWRLPQHCSCGCVEMGVVGGFKVQELMASDMGFGKSGHQQIHGPLPDPIRENPFS